ncbi:hypothetical protein QCM80_16495 [Bradyrhizobium sp. SSUT112]|uniref:hypothetical protein n=1 Tax=Bradyrhizobium sp. SSUT112 TaxID=3040604 RepID=UPI0024472190|nr:hypothetical protein [Bradyrhizobium sp. SSUT112]MDH2352238.1 hypothetical protein [Bradyrhizobium sp. SSUT112]
MLEWPRAEAHARYTRGGKLRDGGAARHHHDVQRKIDRTTQSSDQRQLGQTGHEQPAGAGCAIKSAAPDRLIDKSVSLSLFEKDPVKSGIDEERHISLGGHGASARDLLAMLLGLHEKPLALRESVLEVDTDCSAAITRSTASATCCGESPKPASKSTVSGTDTERLMFSTAASSK